METDPHSFYTAALGVLSSTPDTPGSRFIMLVLSQQKLLLRAVCDAVLKPEQAATIARAAITIDPTLGAEIAWRLAYETSLDSKEVDRLVTILSGVTADGPALPSIGMLLQHANPRVRSKAALIVGRRNPNLRWVARILNEVDPRVRANAIEAMWGLDIEGCREVLWEAANDVNNRVAGNALVALYRLGEVAAIEPILRMAAHESPDFRLTAAWVMGELRDPRFLPVLGRMLAASDGKVRHRVFWAMSQARQHAAAVLKRPRLRVHIASATRTPDGGTHARIAVWMPDSPARVAVDPLQTVITENGELVLDYKLQPCNWSETVMVGFAVPRECYLNSTPIAPALLETLAFKRPQDSWAILQYHGAARSSASGNLLPDMPSLESDPRAVSHSIVELAPRLATAPHLTGAAQVLLKGLSAVNGARHIVLLADDASAGAGASGLADLHAAAAAKRITLHGVAIGAAAHRMLIDLCGRSGGTVAHAASFESAAAAILNAYMMLMPGFEIQYRHPCGGAAAEMKLQIYGEAGFGEDSAPVVGHIEAPAVAHETRPAVEAAV